MKAFTKGLEAFQGGRLGEAEKHFRAFLGKEPRHVPSLNLLTVVLMTSRRFADAEKYIARAVSIDQSSDISFYNYGLILSSLGKQRTAIEQFTKALALNPAVPETWNSRGAAFSQLNEPEKAIADFDGAIRLNPNYGEAWANKGKSLIELRRFDEALAAYDRALSFKPDLAEGWLGRGNSLVRLKRNDEALAAYDRALSLAPHLESVWLVRGNLFIDFKRYGEAVAAYEKAISIRPDLAEAWLGLGIAFGDLNRQDEAFVAYDRAFSLKPDLLDVAGARLHAKMHRCDWANFQKERQAVIEAVRRGDPAVAPFAFLPMASSGADQLKCAQTWTRILYPAAAAARGEAHRHSRLRIGYLSSDFRDHPVAYLTAGMLESHDRNRFEIFAFSTGPDDKSVLRDRIVKSFDHFLDLNDASDETVATAIRAHEIDILVDLGGHTKGMRAAALARRPAPIQVNFLGFPGTTGADFIDYIVADDTLVPQGSEKFYSEKVVYLPDSYMPNDVKGRTISERIFNRSEFQLPEAGTVFCCFNNSYKINPDVFDGWLNILKSVDGSVLWLSGLSETVRGNLSSCAEGAGVDSRRLVFAGRVESSADHLARHRLADLFLDAWPYNAHTTASDALWAGLPVVTLIGETFAGRVAASLLDALGLPELVTHSRDQYEALAIELARDRQRLADIKARLWGNRLTRPVFDTGLFTRHIEAAYQAMHDRYTEGLAPDHIRIASIAAG